MATPSAAHIACAVHRRASVRGSHLEIPDRVLQHDAVSVHIFKCLPLFVPIWVVGLDWFITVPAHALNGVLPFRFLRYVEDQKIVLGRRFADAVILLMSKLKVVRK